MQWLARWWWLVVLCCLAIVWSFWPEYRRQYAVEGVRGAQTQGILLKSVPGTLRRPAEHSYEYWVAGQRYIGIYACTCDTLLALKPREALAVRYAVAQPQINLPAAEARGTGYTLYGMLAAVVLALGALGARLIWRDDSRI